MAAVHAGVSAAKRHYHARKTGSMRPLSYFRTMAVAAPDVIRILFELKPNAAKALEEGL